MEDSNDWLEDFILDQKVDENNVGTDGVEVQDAGKPFSKFQTNVSPVNDSNGMENFSGAVNDGINDNIISENEEEFSNVIEEKSNLAFKGAKFSDVINKGAGKKKKRKKDNIFKEFGLASAGEYVSSNERPIKEAKVVDDDPFDLDPVILGLDSNVVKDRGHTSTPLANSFQALLEANDENCLLGEKTEEVEDANAHQRRFSDGNVRHQVFDPDTTVEFNIEEEASMI
ncbi:hypothetical protein Hanom_Chr03g00248441 [Helianthus anomalus]